MPVLSRPQPSVLLLAIVALLPAPVFAQEKSLEALEEQAIREAVALADPSLVRIETVGGLDQSQNVLFGTGPTSGGSPSSACSKSFGGSIRASVWPGSMPSFLASGVTEWPAAWAIV